MEEAENMKIHPELNNILGRSIAHMVDDHMCAIRDLIVDNYPDTKGIHLEIMRINDEGDYRHRVNLIKEEHEVLHK